ncbi:hypothetical protein GCM10011494_12470 [Novosphingobium endophyticum]|uniref:Calcium-binding protein n=1 Tax=Novosphingobium endophyticum TaxID=1955250 RepID=A0A916TRA5_9SPHN|nr:calcium-binding protein [Novosphingobium endophyticum]GGB95485.1 hypothetical protein GCM10011494_12470 [Novosphingobium endophyticum]
MASNVPAPDEPVGDETGSSTGDDTKDRPDSDGSSTMESFDEAARAYDKAFAGTAAGEKIRGTNAADRIDGHGGNDTLVGRGGDDALYGGLGDDKLLGGTGSDFLDGSKGADKLYGDFGIDKLYGDAGDDLLKGGDGDDWIDGGSGSDRLYGDAGADTFVFDIADLDGLDTIYDFNAAEGDRILVKGLGANSNASFEFVTSGSNTYLEMHDDGGVTQIARIKGVGVDDLAMSSAELGLIWA